MFPGRCTRTCHEGQEHPICVLLHAGAAPRRDDNNALRYMPPEQTKSKSLRATDVYSMGATLIFAATGEHPFPELPTCDVSLMLSEGVPQFDMDDAHQNF
jgi:hypothetical protein